MARPQVVILLCLAGAGRPSRLQEPRAQGPSSPTDASRVSGLPILPSKHSVIIALAVFFVHCTCWQLRRLSLCSAVKWQLCRYKTAGVLLKRSKLHRLMQPRITGPREEKRRWGTSLQELHQFTPKEEKKKRGANENGSRFAKWLRNHYCNIFSWKRLADVQSVCFTVPPWLSYVGCSFQSHPGVSQTKLCISKHETHILLMLFCKSTLQNQPPLSK